MRKQAPNDEDKAVGAQRMRLLDRPAVVVQPILRSEEAAAAKARDGQAVLLNALFRFQEPQSFHLIPPWRDAADAVASAAFDDLREVPLFFDGRGIERQLRR